MKPLYKHSLKALLLEKFELDQPLDTSLEDWKGYFDKAEDLDSSIKDDFLAAREMADEALEMLDDERDNIVAAMEEAEAEKQQKEKEIQQLDNEQQELKKEIQRNKDDYEKIIDDATNQIETFIEKTNQKDSIQ